MEKIEVAAVYCPKCTTFVYSRANHDYRECICGNVAIDGGFSYQKVHWNPEIAPPETVMLSIHGSRMGLYNDWNNQSDKLGRISLIKAYENPKVVKFKPTMYLSGTQVIPLLDKIYNKTVVLINTESEDNL